MKKTSYVIFLVVFTVNRLLLSLLTVDQNLKDFGISKYDIDTLDFQYVNRKSWVIYGICLFDLLYFCVINNDNDKIFHKRNHSEKICQPLTIKVVFIFKIQADKINREIKNFYMFNQYDINNFWKRILSKNQNLENVMQKKSIKCEKTIYGNLEFNYHKLFSKYSYLFLANIIVRNEVSRNIGNYSTLVIKCTNIFIQNENEEYFKTISISDYSIITKIDLIYTNLLKILIYYFTAAQNVASYEFKDYRTDTMFDLSETKSYLKLYTMMYICSSFHESYSGYVAKDGEVVFLIIQVKTINGNIFISSLLATVEGYSDNEWLYYRHYNYNQAILILLAFFSLINLNTLILFSIFKAEVSSYLIKEKYCKYHFVINSYYILTCEFLMRNMVTLQSRIINFEIIQYKQTIIERYQRRFLYSLFSKIKMCRFLPKLRYNNFSECLNNGKYNIDINVEVGGYFNIREQVWERNDFIAIPESSIESFYFQDSTGIGDIVLLDNLLVPIPESGGGVLEVVEECGYFSSSEQNLERDGNVAIPESNTADFYFLDATQINEILLLDNFLIEIVPIPENGGGVFEAVDEYLPIIFNNNDLLQDDSQLTADIVRINEFDDIILYDTEVENDDILQDDSHFAHDIDEDDNDAIVDENEVEKLDLKISDNDDILRDDSHFAHEIYEDDNDTIMDGIEAEEKIDNDNIQSDSHVSHGTLSTGDVVDGKYINEKKEGANCYNILQHNAHNTEDGETQVDEGILPMLDTNMMSEVLFINQDLNNDPVIKNTFYHLDPT